MPIKFKIVTPERTVFEEEVDQATLPIERGEITILPKHMPYIGTLQAGEILLKKNLSSEEVSLATSGGFVEFHDDTLIVLADTAERAEEIDVVRAEEARKRAEELKKDRLSMDDEEYARTAAILEKELARIKVARKHRTHRGITMGEGSE